MKSRKFESEYCSPFAVYDALIIPDSLSDLDVLINRQPAATSLCVVKSASLSNL